MDSFKYNFKTINLQNFLLDITCPIHDKFINQKMSLNLVIEINKEIKQIIEKLIDDPQLDLVVTTSKLKLHPNNLYSYLFLNGKIVTDLSNQTTYKYAQRTFTFHNPNYYFCTNEDESDIQKYIIQKENIQKRVVKPVTKGRLKKMCKYFKNKDVLISYDYQTSIGGDFLREIYGRYDDFKLTAAKAPYGNEYTILFLKNGKVIFEQDFFSNAYFIGLGKIEEGYLPACYFSITLTQVYHLKVN